MYDRREEKLPPERVFHQIIFVAFVERIQQFWKGEILASTMPTFFLFHPSIPNRNCYIMF